jgi:16S rRNA processing protein RimM
MDEAAWNAMAVVGRVARAHGIRGQVIVNPETDFPESRFRAGAELWMRHQGRIAPVTIESVRFHQRRPILGLEGVTTMNEAGALSGAELRVPAEALQPLGDGEFYRHDLVGCRVTLRDGTPVGRVLKVEGDRGSSRLVVEAGGGEVLVPLATEICVRIDPAAGEIVIDPPDGLLDLNR